MFNPKKIKEIREELGYSQTDFYENIMSKASYQRFEKNEKELSLQQLQKICDKIAMRPEEILYWSDVTQLDSLPFWKQKLNIPNYLSSPEDFLEKFTEIENDKDKSFGHYCLYITMISLGIQENYLDKDYFSKKDLRQLKNKYKKRKIFYSFDYEMVSNMVFFVNIQDISFLIDRLFPVTESHGVTFDFCVQQCLSNIISKCLHQEEYSLALDYITTFKSLRKIPRFHIGLSINLEIVYLEQLTNFLQTRDITIFLEAVQTAKMFKKLGYISTYENLDNELRSISQRENFVYPDKNVFATQPYSNDL
ncbi:helix-turn-helix transcriptional regulator [Enterococcus faecalis]|uniref:helix-turn-helix domain-containing protein n=1 Tax=Enterococcus faecalis TaxID=1351 RepID=UPI00338E1AAF